VSASDSEFVHGFLNDAVPEGRRNNPHFILPKTSGRWQSHRPDILRNMHTAGGACIAIWRPATGELRITRTAQNNINDSFPPMTAKLAAPQLIDLVRSRRPLSIPVLSIPADVSGYDSVFTRRSPQTSQGQ
jgi:hypothetical protein